MTGHRATIVILVLISIAALGIVSSTPGQEKPKQQGTSTGTAAFTIAKAVVGTGVENREPAGISGTFPVSTERVYCFLEVTDISKDLEVSFVWFHGQNEMLKTSLALKTGKKWRTWADKNLRGLKGDWKVEIRDAEGKPLKEVKFKVE